MAEQGNWRRRLRGAVAAWAVISAIISPLISGYNFLSAHGHLPAASSDFSAFSIVVNTCLVTAGVLWLGLLTGFAFVGLAIRDERLRNTVAKAVLLLVVAFFFFTGSDKYMHVFGIVVLLCFVCLVSPIAKVIESHFIEAVVAAAALVILALLMVPELMKDWWTSFTGQPDFRLVPLSSMSGAEWGCAVLGALVYAAAYVAFQQWRTNGTWLADVWRRIRSQS